MIKLGSDFDDFFRFVGDGIANIHVGTLLKVTKNAIIYLVE